MTEDRRAYDPFAPHTPATLLGAVTPPEPVEDPAGETEQVGEDDGLDALTKTELVDRADAAGLATSGTKADLIARLRGD